VKLWHRCFSFLLLNWVSTSGSCPNKSSWILIWRSKTKSSLFKLKASLLYENLKSRWKLRKHMRGWMRFSPATTTLGMFSEWLAINLRKVTRFWKKRSCSGSWRAPSPGWSFLILLLRPRWEQVLTNNFTVLLWGGYELEITKRFWLKPSPKLVTSSWAVQWLNAKWERLLTMLSNQKSMSSWGKRRCFAI